MGGGASRPVTWAHPRSRGENGWVRHRICGVTGSSPLTRGKLEANPGISRDSRLIPAHAGKTSAMSAIVSSQAAHPRSRGENWRTGALTAWSLGSSPLTRGKRRIRVLGQDLGRLIPAHAGKTRRWGRTPASRGAHPRSRGENVFLRSQEGNRRGSSPLTRGKLSERRTVMRQDRLIPAHAGKTGRTRRQYVCTRAHPRSRGENIGM